MNPATPSRPEVLPGRLYVEHQPWLRRWLHRRLDCREDAADLAHDVFVRVLASPETPRLHEPRAFLTTLAVRVLARFWRRRDLERAWREAAAPLADHLAPSAEELVEAQDLVEQIDLCLQDLKPAAREAFLLYRLDGLTQAEIAGRTGRSIATIERYLRDAYLHCLASQGLVDRPGRHR